MTHHVKDLKLSVLGKKRIEWADNDMPVFIFSGVSQSELHGFSIEKAFLKAVRRPRYWGFRILQRRRF